MPKNANNYVIKLKRSDKYFLVTRGTATQPINYTFTLGLKLTAPHTPNVR